MEKCIFCQIAEGKITAKIRFSDKNIIALDDNNPQAPVHILIIPKKHITNINAINQADATLIGQMIFTAGQLAKKFKISDQGYRLIFNQGKHSGQLVDHIHLHLIGGRKLGNIG